VHVAIIIDDERLENEHVMLNRLCVGLIDEGAWLTRIVPEGSDVHSESERAVALAARIEYPVSVVPWLRAQRRQRIIERFEKSAPDVLYVSGRSAWSLAMELAVELDRPAAFDIWALSLASRVSRPRPGSASCYVAATDAIARQLRRRVPAELVAIIPVGVSMPPEGRGAVEIGQKPSISIAVLGRCRAVGGYRAVARALALLSKEYPQIEIVVEIDGPREHEIWRLFRGQGLLQRTSSIVRVNAHRQLLTRCDLAVIPEADGEVRTIVLELLAAGVPIVAREDPVVGLFVAGRTASVVRDARADSWATAIRRLIAEPKLGQELARHARAWIDQKHRSSRQAHDLFLTCERLMTGGSYPFATAIGAA
jgi:glycosyltransferase involved in cell wall biosynthesis